MTWKELDTLVDNDLSTYLPEEFEVVENDEISGPCLALEQAFEYVKTSMECADDPAAMKDLTRTAEIIQKAAGRTKGAYFWPFVLIMA